MGLQYVTSLAQVGLLQSALSGVPSLSAYVPVGQLVHCSPR